MSDLLTLFSRAVRQVSTPRMQLAIVRLAFHHDDQALPVVSPEWLESEVIRLRGWLNASPELERTAHRFEQLGQLDVAERLRAESINFAAVVTRLQSGVAFGGRNPRLRGKRPPKNGRGRPRNRRTELAAGLLCDLDEITPERVLVALVARLTTEFSGAILPADMRRAVQKWMAFRRDGKSRRAILDERHELRVDDR